MTVCKVPVPCWINGNQNCSRGINGHSSSSLPVSDLIADSEKYFFLGDSLLIKNEGRVPTLKCTSSKGSVP